MKQWSTFHALVRQLLEPTLVSFGFVLEEEQSDEESALRAYSLPGIDGSIMIDTLLGISVPDPNTTIFYYWLRVQGGLRVNGQLTSLSLRPDEPYSGTVPDVPEYIQREGWIYENPTELRVIIARVSASLGDRLATILNR